jgi:trans-aconitate methyltransferase
LIFKDKYKNKVDLIAIDPSDDIEKAMAKSIGSDVQFERGDIFTYKTDQKFDVVIFTKSLHHCNPVDKVENK